MAEATDISAIQDATDRNLYRLKYGMKDFGDLTEIVGIIFSETGGKVKYKPLLDALISIGKNQFDWDTGQAKTFKASRQTLLNYLKVCDRTVRRHITGLLANQEKAGVTWVEYKQGGMNFKSKKGYSSEFRLVILERAVEAYLRVKGDHQRYTPTGPGSKWKNAALEVAREYPRAGSVQAPTPKRQKKKQPTEQHIRSQAQGSVLRWLRMLVERGADLEAVDSEFNFFYTTTLNRLATEMQTPKSD